MKRASDYWRALKEIDDFWGLDKVYHFLEHYFIASIIGLVFGWVWMTIVSEIWGIVTEIVQSKHYGIPISWKDLLWNNLGLIAGLLQNCALFYAFGWS